MTLPPRLIPLLEQYDFACERLLSRLAGPLMDSGNGVDIGVVPLGDDEYLWEPAPGCWSVRRRDDGPGERATALAGAGAWGRDSADSPHPFPRRSPHSRGG